MYQLDYLAHYTLINTRLNRTGHTNSFKSDHTKFIQRSLCFMYIENTSKCYFQQLVHFYSDSFFFLLLFSFCAQLPARVTGTAMFRNRAAYRGLNWSNNPIRVISSPVIDTSVKHWRGFTAVSLEGRVFRMSASCSRGRTHTYTHTHTDVCLNGSSSAPLSSAQCLFIVDEVWMFILSTEQNKPARSVRWF